MPKEQKRMGICTPFSKAHFWWVRLPSQDESRLSASLTYMWPNMQTEMSVVFKHELNFDKRNYIQNSKPVLFVFVEQPGRW